MARRRSAGVRRGAISAAKTQTTTSWPASAAPRRTRTRVLVLSMASGGTQQPGGVALADPLERQQQQHVGGVECGVPCRLAAYQRPEPQITLQQRRKRRRLDVSRIA